MSLAEAHSGINRLSVRVRGAVQGVGFRPFVHGLAARYRLSGFVLNDEEGVLAEIEGTAFDSFLAALQSESPPLAHIDGIDVTPLPRNGERGFTIRESAEAGVGLTRIVPDAATCQSCLDELFDPESRFHLYPFVTCTHCGPRFTITRRLPYDRPNTSMAGFGLCENCAADYADPANRRFHTETIACPACGPRLSHPVEEIAAALRRGEIVALKGIGGFQLMCDAANEAAVEALRRRKLRSAKPFAIMVANEASVEHIAAPSARELALVRKIARPIVLMRARAGLAPSVAPGLDRIGIMLPSAPVHHLLFRALAEQPENAAWRGEPRSVALVATSANTGGEPLIIYDAEALRGLAGIADMIVTHDRPILVRADDSVMAVIDGAPAYIRRSRGFVPEPIDLGQDGPPVLAVGAHLKSTLCVTRGREAFVSQHVGDLNTADTIRVYEETARHMLEMLDVVPEIVACDLHPTIAPLCSLWRQDCRSCAPSTTPLILRPSPPNIICADRLWEWHSTGMCMAMTGALGAASCCCCKAPVGVGSAISCRSRCRGETAPRASRGAWRRRFDGAWRGAEAAERFPDIAFAGRLAAFSAANGEGAVTTSMGRLFDAAAALLGVCTQQSYEGQAAMELEALVRVPRCLSEGYRIAGGILDFRPLLAGLLEPGLQAREGAELFHGTLIAGLAAWISVGASQMGQTDIVLGGGCLMNRILAEGLAAALRGHGLVPWLPRAVPRMTAASRLDRQLWHGRI